MTIAAVTRFIRVHPATGQREPFGSEFVNGRVVAVSLPRISLQGLENEPPPCAPSEIQLPRAFSRHARADDYTSLGTPAERAKRAKIEIPKWVQDAGLAEDFIDIAMIEDEFEAAAFCRAEKRKRRLS